MVYADLIPIHNAGLTRMYLELLTREEIADLEVTADLFSALGKIDVAMAMTYARETEIVPIPDEMKWLFGLDK